MRYISDCWFCGLSLNPEYIIQGELHVRKNGRILNKKILNALLAGAMLSSCNYNTAWANSGGTLVEWKDCYIGNSSSGSDVVIDENNSSTSIYAYLSKEAYKMLAAAGFDDATISASSDLDEYLIDSLKTQDAKINSWGVGTNLITSSDNPAFGGVYKLAAVKDAGSSNFTPKIKLSENTEKVTNPGNKTVYRIYSKSTGKIKADLICMADEVFDPEETMIIFDPSDTWKKTKVLGGTYELRELLVPVIREGKRVYTSPEVMELREYCKKEQNTLWDESRRLVNPQKVYVDLSQKLYDIKKNLLEEMSEKALD